MHNKVNSANFIQCLGLFIVFGSLHSYVLIHSHKWYQLKLSYITYICAEWVFIQIGAYNTILGGIEMIG